jgi:hypothetical protein
MTRRTIGRTRGSCAPTPSAEGGRRQVRPCAHPLRVGAGVGAPTDTPMARAIRLARALFRAFVRLGP